MASAVQKLGELTPESLRGMSAAEFAETEEKGKIAKERETKAAGERAGRTEAEFYKAYGGALTQPFEKFSPTQETASGFAAIGTLMMVAGGMMGSSGKLSGIGAMNNIAGMMEGYRTGRKDLYEQERQMFEENMKVQEKNRALIKEAFDQALKVAKYDLTGAKNMLEQRLGLLGATIPQQMVKTSGVVPAAAMFNQVDENYKKIAGNVQKAFSQQDLIRIEEARRKAASAAEIADIDLQTKKAALKKAQAESERGGLTVEQQQAKERRQKTADFIVKNKLPLKTQEEMAAVAEFYPDYKPITKVSGPGAFIENVTGEGTTANYKRQDFDNVAGALEGIERASRVQRLAKDPEIKFGVVPSFLQRVQQQVRTSLQSFSPDRETALQQVSDVINSTPIDPNDRNAVFQKEAAFAALAIERAERGGSVLPVGFLDRIGPLLSPTAYTRESFLSILESRKNELKSYLASRYNIARPETQKLEENLFRMTFDPSRVPQESIDQLKSDPKKYKKQFDDVYGYGAAAVILGEE